MDKEKKKNLIQRTISGAIFAVVFVLMIDLSSQTYSILWIVMALLSLIEFYLLAGNNSAKLGTRLSRISWLTIGTLYILQAYLLLLFNFEGVFQDGAEAKHMFVLMIISLIWSNDVGAYLFGITLGKHKMAPSISPKKSWEGFVGGLLFAISVSALWKILLWDKITTETWDYQTEWSFFIVFGLLIALASVVGDLLESKFKRVINVKDSGKFLPGHGGVLDRMDSLLMAVPVASIYLFIYFAI